MSRAADTALTNMQIVVASAAFFVAALCAAVMGYAIQHGATCTVAAVEQILGQGSARRLISLLEAAMWVAGGLVLAQALQAFVVMLLAVGAWTYTDALAELATGMSRSGVARLLLFGALIVGALLGGRSVRRTRAVPIGTLPLLRCFAGGLLMAWGSLLLPGGNDGLVLVGMPLLMPYAWLAFATMCVTIAIAHVTMQSLRRPKARRHPRHSRLPP